MPADCWLPFLGPPNEGLRFPCPAPATQPATQTRPDFFEMPPTIAPRTRTSLLLGRNAGCKAAEAGLSKTHARSAEVRAMEPESNA